MADFDQELFKQEAIPIWQNFLDNYSLGCTDQLGRTVHDLRVLAADLKDGDGNILAQTWEEDHKFVLALSKFVKSRSIRDTFLQGQLLKAMWHEQDHERMVSLHQIKKYIGEGKTMLEKLKKIDDAETEDASEPYKVGFLHRNYKCKDPRVAMKKVMAAAWTMLWGSKIKITNIVDMYVHVEQQKLCEEDLSICVKHLRAYMDRNEVEQKKEWREEISELQDALTKKLSKAEELLAEDIGEDNEWKKEWLRERVHQTRAFVDEHVKQDDMDDILTSIYDLEKIADWLEQCRSKVNKSMNEYIIRDTWDEPAEQRDEGSLTYQPQHFNNYGAFGA